MSIQELVFSTVNGLELKMDVTLPSTATADKPCPALLWWHGGGLLQGSRKTTWPHLQAAPEKHGLAFISADYRLAPQARFPDILADIKAAMDFIRSSAFKSATEGRVDSSKLIVSGGSAGGWLSLLAGTGVGFKVCGIEPPAAPTVIAAIYPISDLLDPFWTTKQEKVTYFPRRIEANELAEYLDPTAPVSAFSPPESTRSNFYHYMIQEALLAELLLEGTGIAPKAFSIAPALRSGEFTAPPTYIVHGTVDDKVPFQQAKDVADALEAKGIEHDFEVREGEDHLFDKEPGVTLDRMYAFIKKHV